MNYKLMLRTLGRTLQLEALCLLLPLVVCLIYREDPKPFLYTIGLVGSWAACWFAFGPGRISSPGRASPWWGSSGFFSACSAPFPSGSLENSPLLPTVSLKLSLVSPPPAPRFSLRWSPSPRHSVLALLLLRIGGMGVLIFTLAFLPKVGGRTQVLVQAEATGPVSN